MTWGLSRLPLSQPSPAEPSPLSSSGVSVAKWDFWLCGCLLLRSVCMCVAEKKDSVGRLLTNRRGRIGKAAEIEGSRHSLSPSPMSFWKTWPPPLLLLKSVVYQPWAISRGNERSLKCLWVVYLGLSCLPSWLLDPGARVQVTTTGSPRQTRLNESDMDCVKPHLKMGPSV